MRKRTNLPLLRNNRQVIFLETRTRFQSKLYIELNFCPSAVVCLETSRRAFIYLFKPIFQECFLSNSRRSHAEFLCAPYAAASFCQQPFTSDLVTYQPYQLLYQAPHQLQVKRKPRPLQPWEDQRPFNPADRFLARAHLLHVTDPPKQLLNGDQWDKVC